jgi:hypothetical protein
MVSISRNVKTTPQHQELIGCRSEVLIHHLLDQRLIHACMYGGFVLELHKQIRCGRKRDMFATSSCVWVGEGRSIVCSIGLTLVGKLLQHKREEWYLGDADLSNVEYIRPHFTSLHITCRASPYRPSLEHTD